MNCIIVSRNQYSWLVMMLLMLLPLYGYKPPYQPTIKDSFAIKRYKKLKKVTEAHLSKMNQSISDKANATFIYNNTTAEVFAAQANCLTTLTKTFEITDAFVVNDLNVGLLLTHTWRGDIQVQLTSPEGTTLTLIPFSSDSDDNYDLAFDDDTGGSLDSGGTDDVTAPNYASDRSVLSTSLSNFVNELAQGTWTLTFCNVDQVGSLGRDLGFISAQLLFDGDAVSADGLISRLICSAGATEITGTVFEDFNFNGIYDNSIEPFGIAGVVVTATDSLGNTQNTDTDASGNYTLNSLTVGRTYRVEFTFPDSVSWARPTIYQGDNGTTVQFVQPGNCANLGAASAGDFCENANPPVLVSCFETGNAVYGATGNENKGIVGFPYNSSGTLTNLSEAAKIYEVGTVWGLAWQASTQRMFSGTFLKRHSGFGPEGIGGVYVTDYSNGAGTVVNSFDLQGVSPANGGPAIDVGSVDRSSGADYILPNDNTTDNWDIDAFEKIGKISFGDVDISPDGRTLWLTNLNQKALISVDVTDSTSYPGTINQYLFSDLTGVPSCTNGDLRPWGLAISKNKGYVGCVCTGENSGTTGNMHAYVLSFDINNPTEFTTEIDFALNYTRENAIDFTAFSIGTQAGTWNTWADTWAETGFGNSPLSELAYPQPILSDLDFLDDGSMVLGFSDRWGFQMGYANYIPVSGITAATSGDVAGDIIKACYINGGFVLEGTGGCTVNDNTSNSLLGNDGPSNNGEFFYRDAFDDFSAAPTYNHNETFIGSLGVLRGTNEVVAAHYDPLDGSGFAFDLGLIWHNGSTGARNQELRIVESGAVQSKGNNLGDLALVCAAAPLEIGNYVWLDSDGDGVQNPGEMALAGIRIELYDDTGTLLAFDTTDANGQYYFSQDGLGSQQWISAGNRLGFGQTYYVAVSASQFSSNELSLGGETYELTIDSTNSGTNRHAIDNDAVLGSGFTGGLTSLNSLPITTVNTGYAGESDHTFDIGFRPISTEMYDYSDLPDLGVGTTGANDYETLDANGGPNHIIIPGLFLGDTVDAEIDGFPDNMAAGDDNDNISDEDGLTIFPTLDLAPGNSFMLPLSVTNTTGDTAYVEVWIDWNGDGDFDEDNEMVADFKDNEDGVFPANLNLTVPENAVTGGLVGVLIRLSNTDNMTPNGRVNSGEVESYLIGIDCPQTNCLPFSLTIDKK